MPGPEPIYLNGRFLAQPVSGVQRYGREIVRALDRRPNAADYVLLTPSDAAPFDLTSIPIRRLSGSGHVWEQTVLAHAARRGAMLSLGGSGPVLHPRQTVVIHDAAVFRHPEHFRPGYALVHRLLGVRWLGARRWPQSPTSPVRSCPPCWKRLPTPLPSPPMARTISPASHRIWTLRRVWA